MGTSRGSSSCPLFPSWIGIWNFAFCGGRKTGGLGDKPSEQGRKLTITQPTCGTRSRIRTQVVGVGGGCSHHCAFPNPQIGRVLQKWSPSCLKVTQSLSSTLCRMHTRLRFFYLFVNPINHITPPFFRYWYRVVVVHVFLTARNTRYSCE